MEAWNARDLDEYLTLYADDVIALYGYGPEPMDRAGVRGFYEGDLAALPGSRIELGGHLRRRRPVGRAASCSGGARTAKLLGVPATGREVEMHGIAIVGFGDGVVVERWARPTCSDCWCRSAPCPLG